MATGRPRTASWTLTTFITVGVPVLAFFIALALVLG